MRNAYRAVLLDVVIALLTVRGFGVYHVGDSLDHVRLVQQLHYSISSADSVLNTRATSHSG